MKKRFVSVLCILAMLLSVFQPYGVLAQSFNASIDSISVVMDENKIYFDVAITAQEDARLIAAVYKKDGTLLGMSCKKIKYGRTNKDITVNAFAGAYYYKIMLWDEEKPLRPVCMTKEGILAGDLTATETSFAIVTSVTPSDNYVNIDYVCNGADGTVKIGSSALMQGDISYDEITVGSVISFIADKKGNATDYAVIAIVDENGKLIASQEGIDAVSNDDIEFLHGYIANKRKQVVQKGEIIDLDIDETVFVNNTSTNQYTYDNSDDSLSIRTGSFMDNYEMDYYDKDYGYTSKVFVKLVDGMVTDIYGFYDHKQN